MVNRLFGICYQLMQRDKIPAKELAERYEVSVRTIYRDVEILSKMCIRDRFEGVQVYLTRTNDQELSLEQRAQIAKACNADFLFSLHFNMSGEHNLYGTEVWTSAFGKYFSAGQTFRCV